MWRLVRSDSNLGLSLSTALQNCCNVAAGFTQQPSVDYFVIDGLSVGGSLTFGLGTVGTGFGSTTVFTAALVPRVGYNFALVEWLSVWPQVSVGFGFVSVNGAVDAIIPIDLYVPFYFHPTENFFFGAGPGVTMQPIDNNSIFTISILRFSMGGSIGLFE